MQVQLLDCIQFTSMTEVDDILKVLKDWRAQKNKTVTIMLTHVEQTKNFKGLEVDALLNGITQFHREIARVENQQILDMKWFDLCLSTKKKLKRWLEEIETLKKNQMPLTKKQKIPQNLVFPPQLTSGRGPNDQRALKCVYRSFVTNFEQAIKNPKTCQFILATYKILKDNLYHLKDDMLNKRVKSISARLAKESSRESKIRMLSGEITPKELYKDDDELYFSQKTRQNIKKIQMEELQRSRTGFYDQMKKLINKDACQECRFCHKEAAYCEDQKQIRASDEPMTRFMRCNACDKSWKD